jgi:hypothetical protein
MTTPTDAERGEDLFCETHEGYRNVWCIECIKEDQAVWRKNLDLAHAAIRDVPEGYDYYGVVREWRAKHAAAIEATKQRGENR